MIVLAPNPYHWPLSGGGGRWRGGARLRGGGQRCGGGRQRRAAAAGGGGGGRQGAAAGESAVFFRIAHQEHLDDMMPSSSASPTWPCVPRPAGWGRCRGGGSGPVSGRLAAQARGLVCAPQKRQTHLPTARRCFGSRWLIPLPPATGAPRLWGAVLPPPDGPPSRPGPCCPAAPEVALVAVAYVVACSAPADVAAAVCSSADCMTTSPRSSIW